jgi:hypothetical protein
MKVGAQEMLFLASFGFAKPMYRAIALHDYSGVKKLLKEAAPDARGPDEDSCIRVAAESRSNALVALFLDYGAKVADLKDALVWPEIALLVQSRFRCKQTAVVLFGVLRKLRSKDIAHLLTKCIWNTRNHSIWVERRITV